MGHRHTVFGLPASLVLALCRAGFSLGGWRANTPADLVPDDDLAQVFSVDKNTPLEVGRDISRQRILRFTARL